MTLQELRFFVIYLSKINPKNEDTRIISFKVNDFVKIMGLDRISISKLEKIVKGLLTKITTASIEGGIVMFQFFKEAVLKQNDEHEWCIEFDCHDRILPYLFDLKGRYFKNEVSLSSENEMGVQ